MSVDRIAYIGADGNLFTVKPDGTNVDKLTTSFGIQVGPAGPVLAQGIDSQISYAWPTWSPDNKKIAASRTVVNGNQAEYSLEVFDAVNGTSSHIYDNEPNTIPIAQGVPHYMLWSPDSRHLSFIASTPRELSLFLSTLGEESAPTRVTGQSPIYYSWTRDSSALLLHRGFDLLLATIPDRESQPENPKPLGNVGGRFRAPAPSPLNSKMVYADRVGPRDGLYITDVGTPRADLNPVMDVGSSSAFLWSPIRDEVAVADNDVESDLVYQRLKVISSDGATQETLVNEPLVALFWSPDGEKIAYIAFDRTKGLFLWKYVSRSGGEPVELVEFVPSSEFLTLATFFDQYAYSNSVWSPDSKSIVFTGNLVPNEPRRNGGSPEGARAYVLDVEEGATPKEVAISSLGVWSWK